MLKLSRMIALQNDLGSSHTRLINYNDLSVKSFRLSQLLEHVLLSTFCFAWSNATVAQFHFFFLHASDALGAFMNGIGGNFGRCEDGDT